MAKVYVSSTRLDLERERKAVIDWLVLANHQPKHSYVADSDTVRDSCLKDVLECDVYVLILGHRYGHVPMQDNPEGRSITELEYRCASAAGKPCVVLIPRGVRDIAVTDLMHPETYAKVQAFQSTVNAERRPAIFGDETELIAALSTGLQQALRDNQEIQREAALAGKPLTSLHLTWEFQGVDAHVAQLLKNGHDDAIAYIMDEQGHRDEAQNSAVFREYQLYPFLVALCRRLTKDTAEEGSANVVVLIALDDDRNAVLSFGFLDDEKPWAGPAADTRLKQVSPPSLEIGSYADLGNSDLRNWPNLTARGSNATITWRLDPSTFAKSLSRQNELIYPNASLPGVLRIAILFDIEQFPFETGNFALAEDEHFWDFREPTEVMDEEAEYVCEKVSVAANAFSSSVQLVPNSSSSMTYKYKLTQFYETMFLDSYGEASPHIRCLVFEYVR